ncbi:MAG: hypothetical protein CVU38_12805 [Chloroflexi bacterium HGW-Chloroflexi-1]|nr:MAG: hypothetical protein CVU38_12805 [Chloroflexi bacterium HGW-Chloroflexi-1]
MNEVALTVNLPVVAFEQLQCVADQQHRGLPDLVRDLVLQELPGSPPLPQDVEAELASYASFPDDLLWVLARSTLSQLQQHELARLSREAQQRTLTDVERARQQELVDAYDRMLMRRAQAALVLKTRGYDLSNLTVLRGS